MNLHLPLSQDEIEELDDFLLSDAMPDEGMDIVMLDGFLTALAVGPVIVPPGDWMPIIWGEAEPEFDTAARAQWFMEQTSRMFNGILGKLANDPPQFEPLLYSTQVEAITRWDTGSWCDGFIQGVEIAIEDWSSLLEDPDESGLLAPMITLGTPEGDEALEKAPDAEVQIEEYVELLGPCVLAINEFWRRRDAPAGAAHAFKTGRNDPCLCGSGRKFKKCCGA